MRVKWFAAFKAISPDIHSCLSPGDKVVVFQPDGEELRGVVILTETLTSGVRVRVRSGDFILNVDEKQVAKECLAFINTFHTRTT
jgi:hypothetical protein